MFENLETQPQKAYHWEWNNWRKTERNETKTPKQRHSEAMMAWGQNVRRWPLLPDEINIGVKNTIITEEITRKRNVYVFYRISLSTAWQPNKHSQNKGIKGTWREKNACNASDEHITKHRLRRPIIISFINAIVRNYNFLFKKRATEVERRKKTREQWTRSVIVYDRYGNRHICSKCIYFWKWVMTHPRIFRMNNTKNKCIKRLQKEARPWNEPTLEIPIRNRRHEETKPNEEMRWRERERESWVRETKRKKWKINKKCAAQYDTKNWTCFVFFFPFLLFLCLFFFYLV